MPLPPTDSLHNGFIAEISAAQSQGWHWVSATYADRGASVDGTISPLAELTDKQREVLDLLIQHKTSKEIGRILDISPHTVDQRIQFAIKKLGVGDRRALALEYRRLTSMYEGVTYEESRVAVSQISDNLEGRADQRGNSDGELAEHGESRANQLEKADYRVVPAMLEGPNGILVRIGAILLIALSIIFVALGGMAIFSEASTIVARVIEG